MKHWKHRCHTGTSKAWFLGCLNPHNIVKKIYGVTVEYASGASNSNGVKYFYTNDSGTKQGTANAGTLASTSNDLDVNRITFGSPLLASSFQVQIDLDGSSIQKVNSVGVEYRPLYKRIT